MKYLLDSKTLLVTGATSGIGRGLTLKFIMQNGCTVIGVGRSREKFEKLKNDLGNRADRLLPFIMDVGDKSEWQRLSAWLSEMNIGLDGIVNCAGILPPFKNALSYTAEQAEEVLRIDYLSCVYSISALYHTLSPYPMIVNISSAAALVTVAGTSIYTAAKSALKGYTEALIEELRGKAYVALAMPGFAKTGIFRLQNTRIEDSRLISLMCTSETAMVNRLYKKIKRNKRRIIAGKDARLMNCFYKFFPKTTDRMIAFILKKSKIKLFDEVFI